MLLGGGREEGVWFKRFYNHSFCFLQNVIVCLQQLINKTVFNQLPVVISLIDLSLIVVAHKLFACCDYVMNKTFILFVFASSSLLPLCVEEKDALEQHVTKCRQSCPLDTVLSSLCPSHRSLLYQILKLAHQENLLFPNHRSVGQIVCHCCHQGAKPDDNARHETATFGECKAHKSSPYYPNDCDRQNHGSTICHLEDCKPNCSIPHYLLSNCKSKALQISSCCNLQKPRMETCTALCPKRLHHNSCHCMAVDNTNNIMCACVFSTKSTSPCIASSNLCASSSTCCNKANLCSCPPLSNNASLALARKAVEGVVKDGDPPCPVLKREQSPSPPPLSPIPSDVDKKNDDKPPSLLHHGKDEGFEPLEKDGGTVTDCYNKMVTAADGEQECKSPARFHAEQNASGTLLQDVVDRFSEKLDTIRPVEKEPPLDTTAFYGCDKESLKTPLTSRNKQFHADAHLTEIITTVLHTGRPSDYNLSELFNRHNSKEPKSPNTRLRRRQEVLAARATPSNEASARRHSLQIKRELAMFDQSYTRKRLLPSKRAKLKDEHVTVTTLNASESKMVKEEPKKEISVDMELESSQSKIVHEGPLNSFAAKTDRNPVKEEILAAAIKNKILNLKSEKTESEIIIGEKRNAALDSETQAPNLQSASSNKGSTGDHMQTHTLTVTAGLANSYMQPSEEGCVDSVGINGEGQMEKGPLNDNTSGENQDLNETRRSRRNIVPPQRFSSFVTESRKMYFVACFSENIFSKKTQKDKTFTPGTLNAVSQDTALGDADIKLNPLTSTSEHKGRHNLESTAEKDGPHQFSGSPSKKLVQQNIAKVESPAKCSPDDGAGDSNCHARLLRRLRSTPNRLEDLKTTSSGPGNRSDIKMTKSVACVENEANHHVQYTSPIKLMFVSPVKDKEGVRYSLKSAGSASNGQAEEPFDPCVESSWSGTLTMKPKNQNTELATSKTKSGCSPSNFATSPSHSPPKSASSSPKTCLVLTKTSSPSKSVSSSPGKPVNTTPKSSPRRSSSSPTTAVQSVSLSPRISPRRSGEGTPTKRMAGTEGQRSPCNSQPLHETTPPKRRPGRPKKLGPPLEQKVKRPIGRPRKQKNLDPVKDTNTVHKNCDPTSDSADTAKNLKITVVYGRSRRNKRTVSEGLGHLQTEFHEGCQTVGSQSDMGVLRHTPKSSSCITETASAELPEELKVVSTVRETASQCNSSIKYQKQDQSVPLRKPGRPAKVKISGISVTVTTVSPRQRKIQISKNTRQSPATSVSRKVLLPQLKSTKEPVTIRCHSANVTGIADEAAETYGEKMKGKLPNQPVAVRHSMRVRKPSIHFLHAVATSAFRSYSHSNALLRRSKQFLLNKASSERRPAAQESSVNHVGPKKQASKQKRHYIPQDLSRVAGVSVDSIFPPEETLRWWAASAEEKTMNQELARRIQHISDTWISDTAENEDNDMVLRTRASTMGSKKSKHSSVVRTLFDCSPNKPRSCSMQQLCSWFMQTTETQSLAIVKKTSSRNPYEVMHFPRSVNKKSICHSPQAERLHKHVKKFARNVPKTPLQHQQAQRRLRNMRETWPPTRRFRRQLFSTVTTIGRYHKGAGRSRHRAHGKYQATLLRARTRFLSYRERKEWHRRKRDWPSFKVSNGHLGTGLKLRCKRKALCGSARHRLLSRFENYAAKSPVDQTRYSTDVPKEQNLCSKAWSPQTLKECRVFLRKINSPDNVSCTNSCTVTLEDGSPSTYLYSGHKRELVEVVKTVKTERKMNGNQTSARELAGAALKSLQDQDEMPNARQKGKYKSSGTSTLEPPPPKMLRQSRMRGLTGPRWCDYVFGNYPASFEEYCCRAVVCPTCLARSHPFFFPSGRKLTWKRDSGELWCLWTFS